MRHDLYILALLEALEEYIPYMSEDEVAGILFGGEEPDAVTVWGWEVRRATRRAILARQFREAERRQKLLKNCEGRDGTLSTA